MKKIDYATILLTVVVSVYGVTQLFLTLACTPPIPTPTQEARLGLYEAALQGCIAQARIDDAGYSGYKRCADDVTFRFFTGKDGGQ